jgi:hypothetical protein
MPYHAKVSIARLLRAPWNFEEDYTGKAGNVPILFTHPFATTIPAAGTPDVYTAVDEEASQNPPPTGVSPVLAKFSSVPIGSTACLYYPIVRAYERDGSIPEGFAYVWRIVFRLRSVADYTRRKRFRLPYSIGISRFGAADNRAGVAFDRPNVAIAGPRYVRPATMQSIIYNRGMPSPTANPPFFGTLHSDAVAIPVNSGSITETPVYPGAGAGGAGTVNNLDYEQGEYDPSVTIGAQAEVAGASHIQVFQKCLGNEVAVECFKYNLDESGTPYTPRPWEFTFDGNGNVVAGEDQAFSVLLGVGARGQSKTPPKDTGVRLTMGAWPR